jgi:hypothetical protein
MKTKRWVGGWQKVAEKVGRWAGGTLAGGTVEWVAVGWSDGWSWWEGRRNSSYLQTREMLAVMERV